MRWDYHFTQTIIGTSQLKADGGRLKSFHVKREGPIAKINFYKRTLFRSVKLAIARSAPDNGSKVGSLANTLGLGKLRLCRGGGWFGFASLLCPMIWRVRIRL